jgi:homoserine O-acetyltransferase
MRSTRTIALTVIFASTLVAAQGRQGGGPQPQLPRPVEGDAVIRNFTFRSGEALPELKLHYRTLGTLKKDARGRATNAVWIGHGTTGSGSQFGSRAFAGELFLPGQLLDVEKYFIIMPDGIGHGASSKPSDGLRAKFPRYGYLDMIDAQYRLLTEHLGVNHLRLAMGTSMGGMHSWIWGQRYPDFMDALMPLASLPTQISGRNRAWRRVVIDAIRHDPTWQGGNYTEPPQSARTAALMLWLVGSNPVLRQRSGPTLAETDKVLDNTIRGFRGDVNDTLYAIEASHDYDPAPGLEKIAAPLMAVNFADDLINPPELGIFERETKRVKNGCAITVPASDRTSGHGTHTVASVWKPYLAELLAASETPGRALECR